MFLHRITKGTNGQYARRLIQIAGLVLLTLAPVAGWGEAERVHGLMWNRTELPAVFPLRVRTEAGIDYVLHLRDAETGAAALAAFIEGGRHFRVLVPPGRFWVRFVAQTARQAAAGAHSGADDLNQTIELGGPLEFGVRDFATKGGYAIDLTDLDREGRVEVIALNDCQTYRVVSLLPDLPQERQRRLPDTLEFYDTPLERLAAERALDLVIPERIGPTRGGSRTQRIEVRRRVCAAEPPP